MEERTEAIQASLDRLLGRGGSRAVAEVLTESERKQQKALAEAYRRGYNDGKAANDYSWRL